MLLQVPAPQAPISAPIATIIAASISATITIIVGIWVARVNRKTQKIVQQKAGEQAKDIERVKSELLISANKQAKLYEKRLEVIGAMHKMVEGLYSDLSQRIVSVETLSKKISLEKLEDEREECAKALVIFGTFIRENNHYFDNKQVNVLKRLQLEFIFTNHDIFDRGIYNERKQWHLEHGFTISDTRTVKEIGAKLSEIIKQLEDEFRNLLGV